jgi:chloramphenicol O-acetyltransferase
MDSVQQLLPYRITTPDQYDTMYATKLNELFKNLSPELQTAFQKFTKKIMDEKQIGRNSLLQAIDDFTKQQSNIGSNLIQYNEIPWIRFVDLAFNYRPYQGCSVM